MTIDCRPKCPARHRIATASLLLAFGVMTLAIQPSYADPVPPEIPFAGCRFFEHRDYVGHNFDVAANTDVSWVGGAWNDKISSFSCSAGCDATVYEDRDFGGAYVSGAYINYDTYWNDRISSMKVVCSAPPSPKPHGPFTGTVPATRIDPNPPPPQAPASLTTGTFDTSFGVLVLRETEGTYTVSNGHVTVFKRKDNIIRGLWEQSTAAHRCDDGRYWGSFIFNFNADGFTGSYGYCHGPVNAGPWNGTRR